MKQKQTLRLYEYWKELYSRHGVPERRHIEPAAISDILGDTFILETDLGGNAKYRLAGTRLCAIAGHELKGQNFSRIWQSNEQKTICDLLKSAGSENVAILLGSSAHTKDNKRVPLETLVLPLLHDGEKGKRLLGITTAQQRPHWLGSHAIISQAITSLRIIDISKEIDPFNVRFSMFKTSSPTNHLHTLSSLPNGRQVKHLVVMDGGKAERRQNTTL